MDILHEEKMGYLIDQKRSLMVMGERLSISDEGALKKFIPIYKKVCKSRRNYTRFKLLYITKIIKDIYKYFFPFVNKNDFIQPHNQHVDNAMIASRNVADALEIARKTDFELWSKLFPVFFKPTEILIAFKKN